MDTHRLSEQRAKLLDCLFRIDCAASEGRLIQNQGSLDRDGVKFVGILAATAEDADRRESVPSEFEPEWFKDALEELHNNISIDQFVPMAALLTATLRQAFPISDTDWERVRIDWLCSVIDHAIGYARLVNSALPAWPPVEKLVERPKSLCVRAMD